MTEEYLHYLWMNKLIPLEVLEFNSVIKIHHFGEYNRISAGPDFQHACIEMDGLFYHGSVELHLKSSDWFKHRHQLDRRYDNVVLHVVYENDRDVVVNGMLLPCIELKHVLDLDHYIHFERFKSQRNKIWCSNQLMFTNSIDWIFRIEKELHNRFRRRLNTVAQLLPLDFTDEEMFYALSLKALFTSSNKFGAEDLLIRYPYKLLKHLSTCDKISVLRIASGLDHKEESYLHLAFMPHINELILTRGQVAYTLWNYRGVRPSNFPCNRINSLYALLECFTLIQNVLTNDLLEYSKLLIFLKENWGMHSGLLNQFVLNAYVPYLFHLAENKQSENYSDYALKLLRAIPTEKNSIIRKWEKAGVKIRTAYESQYFLEVFNEFCNHKKCLSCNIGKELLG